MGKQKASKPHGGKRKPRKPRRKPRHVPHPKTAVPEPRRRSKPRHGRGFYALLGANYYPENERSELLSTLYGWFTDPPAPRPDPGVLPAPTRGKKAFGLKIFSVAQFVALVGLPPGFIFNPNSGDKIMKICLLIMGAHSPFTVQAFQAASQHLHAYLTRFYGAVAGQAGVLNLAIQVLAKLPALGYSDPIHARKSMGWFCTWAIKGWAKYHSLKRSDPEIEFVEYSPELESSEGDWDSWRKQAQDPEFSLIEKEDEAERSQGRGDLVFPALQGMSTASLHYLRLAIEHERGIEPDHLANANPDTRRSWAHRGRQAFAHQLLRVCNEDGDEELASNILKYLNRKKAPISTDEPAE